jgi:ribonucleoside-triphosphate reductase
LALFGKHHFEDDNVYQFALEIYNKFDQKKKEAEEKYNLNFSTYASPCESSAYTINQRLKAEYGNVPLVLEHDYLTNSFHCPVWYPVSAERKIKLEAPFHKIARGGCITYVECESLAKNNIKALEQLVTYAMDNNISYFAMNFSLNSCLNCGTQSDSFDKCPKCGSTDIQHLARITGYLTGDYKKTTNNGKQQEIEQRVKHLKDGNVIFK